MRTTRDKARSVWNKKTLSHPAFYPVEAVNMLSFLPLPLLHAHNEDNVIYESNYFLVEIAYCSHINITISLTSRLKEHLQRVYVIHKINNLTCTFNRKMKIKRQNMVRNVF